MIELTEKYVFHIPMYKYVDDELVLIELDSLLDDLINEFAENGFDSMYITKVKSLYKSRCFDEILITIFASSSSPAEIFEKWFLRNNNVLVQDAFAYEINDKMVIKELKL